MNINDESDDDTLSSSHHTMLEAETPPPYLPPSMLEKRVNWDVFLSFRGGDTRHKFTTPLRDALKSRGLRPFMDDEGMEKGDTIQPTLEEAIVDSALAVAIISPNYADSRWCLDELFRIFECRKRVIPVFYHVDPSDVRRQRGVFGNGFKTLINDESKKFSEADIERWRNALKRVGNISGYPCRSQSDEPEAIRSIVQQVWNELKNTPEYVVRVAVGLDSRVDKVVDMLELGSKDVRFLCIHGTPGIGKTTLAKAVFNKLVVHFRNRCFISNVREKLANEGGILAVQNELIKYISLGSARTAEQVDAAKSTIKGLVQQYRVLVVLDDVFEAEQLEDLGIVRGWFDQGSRIIVTSRNVDALLKFARNDELYEAEKLDDSESLELFSVHALGRREPTPEFRDVAKEIVSLTGGLSLALEVFGSSLVKKTIKEWEDAVMKLRLIRPPNLQQVLKFSYDGLDDQEKTVFLDISCLLLQLNMKREDIVDVLAGCDLRAELAIGKLVEKSLLKIREGNELWMHDQIRDMGRQIVKEDSFHDVGKQSRLWDFVEIMRVLRKEKVTEAARGIVLDIKKPPDFTDEMTYWFNFKEHPNIKNFIKYLRERFNGFTSRHRPDEDDNSILHTKWFEKLMHLKLLRMDYAKLQGDFDYMPSELRWLRWKGCSLKTLTANIPEELRVLDLSGSKIERLWSSDRSCWGFNKVVGNLVVINLSYCPKLTALPDMSGHRHLKKLILERCVGLNKVHESIGNMSSLVHLNLLGCSNLVEFPRDVTGMKGLKDLILSDCSKFRQLPQDVWSMTSLMQLLLDRTAITELPRTVYHLTQLEVLSLRSCHQLTCLPDSIGSLNSLKELSLLDTKIETLPCSIGSLTHLENLNLMHCSSLTALPESVGNLKTLTQLLLNASSIQQLPASICSLSYLRVLSLGRCRSLAKLPDSLGGLASIVELELDHTPIKVLPDEICSLKFVEKFRMNNCTLLEKLPESIGDMLNLNILFVEGSAITQLPESIGELENLMWLKLTKCRKLSSLPNSIGRLRSLRILMMEETAVTCLPKTFGLLDGLRILKMKKSSNDLPKLSVLPTSLCKLSNLEELYAHACGISGEIKDDFNELSKLELLDLGYNSFHNLPSTLEGLGFLKKLILRHCKNLRFLPHLPSTLEELNAADCHSLESIFDLSNLERLQELQLSNCSKILDVPGLQCLKSLRRLFMGGCNASASAIRRRLSKAALRNLNDLCVPGSEIPGWFSQTAVNFTPHPNLAIKSVIVAVVVSVDIQVLDADRAQLPSIVDLKATIIREEKHVFNTTMNLMGLPLTREEQLYLCRYKEYHPLVSMLRKGDIIQVGWQFGTVNGIELRSWGIHLVFENDDDYDGDEDSLSLIESEQSVSQRLVRFFRSIDQNMT